ncbi:MAG TPA: N-acetylmuramoyl-L-alanine amidase [Syntrophales bacterium]|jgi:N-acetylmuramoyl-L-alanine amidase|nr:N-acetylmuramoyl-L-alanine amidase [Syntrophales bacterium]HON22603.1 N-acetylmuramoyl-L-alanine amidase [Syntrophales bacterium]HOU77097.1 N-acetylmuramoyl-L-alanine amidase [Syntrophales bacterium]HPC32777.1 N-acetylmuramoyl-L-alanine amidase [Syntrophales bacterium]HQG33625.1 N-acetylmuramoyl-L-alanine amidase [Syntrophales bacterium]
MHRIKITAVFSLVFLTVVWGLGGVVWPQPGNSGQVIVIDAAHGGTDNGVKIGDKLYEKDCNLRLALALQNELVQAGYRKVVLTRSTDRDVPFKERRELIRKANPGLVISLHANAGFGSKARGYELYFPGFKTGKESKNDPAAIISDMTKNKHLNDSVRVAQHIQKHLAEVFPKENRGLREAPLPLLEGINVPAVIIEIGFLTNKENRQQISEEKSQAGIARAIARGVREGM